MTRWLWTQATAEATSHLGPDPSHPGTAFAFTVKETDSVRDQATSPVALVALQSFLEQNAQQRRQGESKRTGGQCPSQLLLRQSDADARTFLLGIQLSFSPTCIGEPSASGLVWLRGGGGRDDVE
eukprot:569694-Rhodomonas_salina.1